MSGNKEINNYIFESHTIHSNILVFNGVSTQVPLHSAVIWFGSQHLAQQPWWLNVKIVV
jgi:hypothetical protein